MYLRHKLIVLSRFDQSQIKRRHNEHSGSFFAFDTRDIASEFQEPLKDLVIRGASTFVKESSAISARPSRRRSTVDENVRSSQRFNHLHDQTLPSSALAPRRLGERRTSRSACIGKWGSPRLSTADGHRSNFRSWCRVPFAGSCRGLPRKRITREGCNMMAPRSGAVTS